MVHRESKVKLKFLTPRKFLRCDEKHHLIIGKAKFEKYESLTESKDCKQRKITDGKIVLLL